MTCPLTQIRIAPITTGLIRHNPRILLGGTHQPTLLRYLDGWPRRSHGQRAFLVQFVEHGESLARFASDSFDFAVLQAPSRERLGETLGELTRVARQGLITLR
ncbi:class I SAM-dependent methyltransferase [Phytopseudomonas dryadis]|uniref:Class I SAM-dependent methyltransferase n=1 Tax=Phytopseudomonas dryadis TaxID=2487520 RepID=A0A4Q9RCP9_9GAMM|nr:MULTISPECIES: class I SAM-dependent methyltransferase [Pseudomonas]TBU97662.1 hypothetical protein DNK44_01370 [Pseudomonas dryadis]TBV10116.1 hypothetical protein DNK34_01380 [Pseudomonas dryadis]TBV19052.1 hypothetical protein DNK41_04865 [Pseudomonas sp. FRB 230]